VVAVTEPLRVYVCECGWRGTDPGRYEPTFPDGIYVPGQPFCPVRHPVGSKLSVEVYFAGTDVRSLYEYVKGDADRREAMAMDVLANFAAPEEWRR
jgi:hypothetical protein